MALNYRMIALLMSLSLFAAGCSPLRGYKFATHDPTCTNQKPPYCSDAGDLTHAQDPGARVVVPKK